MSTMWSILQEANMNKDWDALLFTYIKQRDISGIEMCLSEDADINKCDARGQTPVAYAVRLGNRRILNYLITNCADLNRVGSNGETPLYAAISENFPDTACLLIEKGADVDGMDGNGETALARAASLGQKDIATHLLSLGADISKREKNGKTPVAKALLGGNWDVASFLFSKGATLDDEEIADLVHYSESSDNVEIVKHMVEASVINLDIAKFLKDTEVDLDKVHADGDTFLATFASKGNAEMVDHLLQKNVDIDKFGRDGKPPLIRAVDGGHSKVVKLLLGKSANVNVVDADGKTALTHAILGRQSAIFKELILEEVDFCKSGKNGITPLAAAVQIEDFEMVKLLIDTGAGPTMQTAFLTAIEIGNVEIVKYMKSKGADVNWVYKNGATPLTKAITLQDLGIARFLIDNGAIARRASLSHHLLEYVGAKNFDLVRFLVEIGADVNAVGDRGHTPLTRAVQSENFKMVKFLVQNGAGVNVLDGNRKSALAIAASSNFFQICQYLMDSGASPKSARPETDEYASWNEDFAVYLKTRKSSSVRRRSSFTIVIKEKLFNRFGF